MFNIFHKRKLLTIIIPVFNSSEYLEQCLESVCNQAVDDCEIIAINDNSTDNSQVILRKYRKIYPFIKLVENTETSGPGYSRNFALNMAKGKYIAFVDSDDYVAANYFNFLINCAEQNSSDIVFSEWKLDSGNLIEKSRIPSVMQNGIDIKREIISKASCAPWAKLYSSEFVRKNKLIFANNAYIGEDVPFTWISYVLAEKIDFETKVSYFYRINLTGCDHIVDRRIFGVLESLRLAKDRYNQIKIRNYDDLLINLIIKNIYYNYKKVCMAGTANSLVVDYLARSRVLVEDLSGSEIVSNIYLTEQEKLFFEDCIKVFPRNFVFQEIG